MYYGRKPSRAYHAPCGNRYSNPYFKKHQTVKKPAAFYYSLILLGLAVMAWIYFLFASSVFRITDWQITGLEKYNNRELSVALKNFLDQPKFIFFKSSNIFMFDKNDFEKYLSKNFIFQNITLKKYYPHKIIINLEEKKEKMAIYNDEKIFILADDGTIVREKEGTDGWYSTDQNGNADAGANGSAPASIDIEKVLADSKTKELPPYPIFCDAYYPGENLSIGMAYPAAKIFSIVNEFIQNTESRTDVRIKLVALYKNQTNAKIIIYTKNNWEIYLNDTDDGLKQFYKFYVTFNEKIKDINKPLEYIDLRFGDRVYIK